MTDSLPNFLTHYYRDQPFRSLSHLSAEALSGVLAQLSAGPTADFRLTRSDYMSRRKSIEDTMRDQFIARGGRPKLAAPFYAILGAFSLYEGDPSWRSVTLPLDSIAADVLSFTFTDSFFAFSDANLRGVPIPPRPYHRQVFLLEELPGLVAEYGLPGERWRTEEEHRFDVYIEAQIWAEPPSTPPPT